MKPMDNAALAAAVAGFAGRKVLVLGDLMLDHYLFGDAERVSPEAPVPVVLVERETRLLGGAGNVVNNVLALGGVPRLISLCGDDAMGRELDAMLDEKGIPHDLAAEPGRPTTIKTRVVARSQQMLRVDFEKKHPAGPQALARVRESLAGLRGQYDVVVLSDYGKGFFHAATMELLRREFASWPRPPLVLVDPKTSNYHLYHGVFALTPNRKEAGECAGGVPLDSREEILAAGDRIFRKLECSRLVVTLGADGMAVFEGPEKVWLVPNQPRRIFDVTGSRDTVIAALALGLAGGLSLLDACVLANHAAGVVVGKVGAATVAPEELLASLNDAPPLEARVWRAG